MYGWYDEPSGKYDVAQICLNGHVANSSVTTFPEGCREYCNKCGEKTIVACPSCSNKIRGSYTLVAGGYNMPSYCEHCGKPFPWVAKRLEAAEELAELIDEFSVEDRMLLKTNLGDIVRDNPRSQVAALKVKKVLSKASPHFISAFRDILINVISDPINKQIW